MLNHATDYPLWIDMSRNVLGRCSCLASLSRWKTHGGRVVFASVNTALRPGEQCIWMSWITGRLHYVRVENLVGLVEVMSVRWMWVRSTVQSCSSFSKTWCGLQWNHTHFKVPFLNLANPFHTLSSYSHSTTVLNTSPNPVSDFSASWPWSFQIHHNVGCHIALLRQFQVHSKSIGYVCLHWVNELREGVVEVGIDLRIRVMSSKDKVLV